LKTYGERTEQGISEEPAPGKAILQVCFERAEDVRNLPILDAPLVNQFHVTSSVVLRKRLLQKVRFEIEEDPGHRTRKRYRMLSTS
jgi:hypothetical protein